MPGGGPRAVELVLAAADARPPARAHVVEAAAARLAAGERPSSYAIADMAIRRVATHRPGRLDAD